MSGGYEVWKLHVLRWRQQYPQRTVGAHDPSIVSVYPLRCVKCGRKSGKVRITRHHKGHEYFFAVAKPEWYAGRYIAFHAEDIVPLCSGGKKTCHSKIHKIYNLIIEEAREYIRTCIDTVTYDDGLPVIHYRHEPSFQVLESFRKRLVTKCDQWLRRKNRKPSRRYRDNRI